MAQELAELLLPDQAAWRAWLLEHHDTSPGVRLVLHKAGGHVTTLTHALALDEALCFGWIDGRAGRRDAGSWTVRYTPRRPTGTWSRRNVDLVARLEAEGRMHPAGTAAVDAARADGRWAAAYEPPSTAQVPADLAAALAADPAAQAQWDVLTKTNRYAVILRVTTAKRAETRARRIARHVDELARGVTPYPQRTRPEE